MTYDTVWKKGEQEQQAIRCFLKEVDDILIPKLSCRVNLQEYAYKLSTKADTVWILNENQVVASSSIYCDALNAFVSSFAVKKEFQKQHIGKWMMEQIFEHVQNCGCNVMQLEVSRENEGAINFYKYMGFSIINETKTWYTMEKSFRRRKGEFE